MNLEPRTPNPPPTMAKQNYLPRGDTDFLAWLNNFKTQLTTLGAGLGSVGLGVAAGAFFAGFMGEWGGVGGQE